MKLNEALEKGLTEYGKPEKIITTLVSKVYICGDKVLKVYNQEEYFFADLKTFESRKAFYEEDFFWNNNASPEVYLHLWGVKCEDDKFELVPPNMGEDFMIEMSRIDDSKMLTKVLNRNELTKELATDFIDSLMDVLALLTRERRQKLDHLFKRGLYEIMVDNTKSLHDWMLSEPRVPKEDADKIFTLLSKGLEVEPYFKNTPIDQLSAAFDNNCDNLILLEDKPSYIDILSPMEVWRVVDEYATISRTIVDIEVLQSMEMGQVARDTYEKYGGNIPKIARVMHELRATSIQWPYRYMIKQDGLAKKFEVYTREKMRELEDLLQE